MTGKILVTVEVFDCGFVKLTMNLIKPYFKSFGVKSLAICSITDLKKP